MPYIAAERRPELDPAIDALIEALNTTEDPLARAGETNYSITSLLLGVYPQRKYALMALVDGILAGVGREYYRRRAAPYEDEKIAENGDVY